LLRFWISACILACSSFGQIAVSTAHFDNSRSGWNPGETQLTPSAVSAGFQKLGTLSVDAPVYAQPLVLPSVITSGKAHDLVIVATLNNSLFAFDLNAPASPAVWNRNLGPVRTFAAPLIYNQPFGCVSTPVADPAAFKLYAVCATPTSWVLYALDFRTGVLLNSVTISGQVPGSGDTGDTVINGMLQFNPAQEFQRAALTLANGKIYVTFGSFGDSHPWHGWAFAYDSSTLAQTAIYCTSPSSFGAGLWGGSGGFSVDTSGNLYFPTGNGPWDGTGAWGESVLKFDPKLNLIDFFTPGNWAQLNTGDWDLSSGRAMLVPNSTLLIFGAKDYRVYLLDTLKLGSLGGADEIAWTNSVITPTDHSGIYGGVVFPGRTCFPNTDGPFYCFPIQNGKLGVPVISSASYGFPGAQFAASGSGSNTILWAVTAATSAYLSSQAGTLRAFDPVTLAELYNSDLNSSDRLGTLSKFSPPVVANGKVLVGTLSNAVVIYGLTPPAPAGGLQILVNGTASAVRAGLNLIAGSNVTITAVDNPGANRTDVTIQAVGSGGGGITVAPPYFSDSLNAYVPSFTITKPIPANFAWQNQGGATNTTTPNGAVRLQGTQQAGDQLRFWEETCPAAPYTLTTAFIPQTTAPNFNAVGFGFQDSVSGRFEAIVLLSNNGPQVEVEQFTNLTTFSAHQSTQPYSPGQLVWFRIANTGANLTFSWSTDGLSFFQVFSDPISGGFINASPSRCGFVLDGNSTAAGAVNAMTVVSVVQQ
jgi:hypothetical protein